LVLYSLHYRRWCARQDLLLNINAPFSTLLLAGWAHKCISELNTTQSHRQLPCFASHYLSVRPAQLYRHDRLHPCKIPGALGESSRKYYSHSHSRLKSPATCRMHSEQRPSAITTLALCSLSLSLDSSSEITPPATEEKSRHLRALE